MLTKKQVDALCEAANRFRDAGITSIKVGDVEMNLQKRPTAEPVREVVLLPGEPTVKDTVAEQSRRAKAEAEELLYGVTL